jgi:hypothetical protein
MVGESGKINIGIKWGKVGEGLSPSQSVTDILTKSSF